MKISCFTEAKQWLAPEFYKRVAIVNFVLLNQFIELINIITLY